MHEDHAAEAEDRYLKEMKEARDVSAVFKLKLISLRASDPQVIVFVFEGVDDKKVYFHWVRRISTELSYEAFVCGGKGKLLKFLATLRRDRSNAASGVYFFMDRDFDDHRVEAPGPELFMTQTYSFENALVGEQVVDELLRGELHCHAEPACRADVVAIFRTQYEAFLASTRDVNFRLFVARKLGIEVDTLPSKINLLAKVELDSVAPSGAPLDEIVPLATEPSEEQMIERRPEFEALDPRTRYRGKYALLFFLRWVRLLIADRNDPNSHFFAALQGGEFKAGGEVSLDIPAGLQAFVGAISAPPG